MESTILIYVFYLWVSNANLFTEPISSVWQHVKRAPPDHILALKLGLRHHDHGKLKKTLDWVSDPRSPGYTKYLTPSEMKELLGARPEPVIQWLRQFGLQEFAVISGTGDWIDIKLTTQQAERLLKTKFDVYKWIKYPEIQAIGAKEYVLPDEISTEVEIVYGIGIGNPRLPPWAKRKRKKPIFPEGVSYPPNTPSTLYKFYNYTSPAKVETPAGANAVFMESEGMKDKHVEMFFKLWVPELQGQKPILKYGKTVGLDDGEGAMDLEYIMTFGRWLPTYYYEFDNVSTDRQSYAALATWADMLINSKDDVKPWVGTSSFDPIQKIPASQIRTDTEFMKAGVAGISILYANGDDSCNPNKKCTMYDVDRPVGPHVTLCGGVACNTNTNAISAWDGSSGGFTEIWSQPEWQQAAIKQYLNISSSNLPPAGMWNASARGNPDVGLCSNNVQSYDNHGQDPGGGTSFAAPQFAGMISSMNQKRAEIGKKPLGYLNPLLYQLHANCSECFFDVVKGNNGLNKLDCPNKCTTRACEGFYATKGWDPITGVGQPNYGAILARVLQLP